MNIYFLVEGKTERKVYPKWLAHLVPDLKRVDNPTDVIRNQYFLISGGGYPGILDNHLVGSIEDIKKNTRFDYLVLLLDTDDDAPDEKIKEVELFVKERSIVLSPCQLVIIPQVICMETWFLGHRKIYTRVSPDADCSFYAKHYDVSKNDPELMPLPQGYNGTNADFHYNYLKVMLRSKNIRYSKSNPLSVYEAHYINELKNRVTLDALPLKSLGQLFDFFQFHSA